MIFRPILEALFPNTCIGCGEVIAEDEHLCEYCHEIIERCPLDKICLKCGFHEKHCICAKRIYTFAAAIAPFYNEGVAKRMMYAFKFRQKEAYSKYFSEQMALAVKQCLGEVKIDIVTYVPMHHSKERRRGYNQSRILAEQLSQILNIPLCDNALGCCRKRKIQHELPLAFRFDNVRGIYYTNFKVTGKTVLLVDDIKTTGATLDECSKQLLIAGADDVYCVSGLMSKYRKKKGKTDGNRYRN